MLHNLLNTDKYTKTSLTILWTSLLKGSIYKFVIYYSLSNKIIFLRYTQNWENKKLKKLSIHAAYSK